MHVLIRSQSRYFRTRACTRKRTPKCTHMRIYIRLDNTQKFMCIHSHSLIYTQAHTHTHKHTQHSHTHTLSHTHTYPLTYTPTHIRTHIHIHTHTHKHTHTHTHTHTHVQTHIYKVVWEKKINSYNTITIII